MKIVYFLSLVFCIYATVIKGFYLIDLSENINYLNIQTIKQQAFLANYKFQYNLTLILIIVFSLLILSWIFSFFKKIDKLKLLLVAITIFCALLMSIADNFGNEVYVSDKIVGGRIL
jgi:hypothetical protein